MLEPFTQHEGRVVPLDRINVDTDQIIPKQFLKRIERTGFGQFLFNDWRFLPDGSLNTAFVLNEPRYQGTTILVAGDNFGCGSSREHAPWALQDYGFRVVISPSFADIFYNNCFKNGLLPVVLSEETIRRILADATAEEIYTLSVDLEAQTVSEPDGTAHLFEVDPFRKTFILDGLDEIGWTLRYEEDITAYENSR
ncbi:MAG TPA: 3-isopropylmalate dehydratase small subunit [candidate division Zixibacteria bacterium]|jgi:3-isopropylmalate/(R)-2-methylmalate dehydratase small subunit|nr:3-isopropylmalate dehydratase small subunit [candidate division Zixibacteria bacterium]